MHSEQNLTAMIVPFYLGEKPDSEGRKIQQIWAWDYEALECAHDYIQWLFPITEKSHFNACAPVIDEKATQAFRENSRLRENLRRSLSVVLKLYGLSLSEDKQGEIVVEKSEIYLERKPEWVNRFDHNYLRITRILKCLVNLDLKPEAVAFYDCLSQIRKENADLIGGETFQYWTEAVSASKNSLSSSQQ